MAGEVFVWLYEGQQPAGGVAEGGQPCMRCGYIYEGQQPAGYVAV